MSSLSDTLIEAGLDPSMASIYVHLAGEGELGVSSIQEKTALSRAAIYDAINRLMASGYVEYRKEGRNAYYKAAHPNKLFGLIEQKKRDTALFEGEMNETIGALIGSYNLTENKPGVRYSEGKEGIIQAYEEMLDIGGDIDSIEDKGEMAEFIPDYFPEFIKKRIVKNIFNRVVSPSSNPINISSETEKRLVRSIPIKDFPFTMDIKICKDTVLLVTLEAKQAVAVRIDDPLIAKNFKLIFEFFWRHANQEQPNDAKSTDREISSIPS